MLSITYILKEMLAQKTRFYLTVFAIAWGAASITIMLAVGEGLRLNFTQAMQGVGKDILVVQAGQTSKNYQGIAINTPVKLTWQDYLSLKNGLAAASVTPEYTLQTKLIAGDHFASGQISAVFANYQSMRNIKIQANGRFINSLDNSNRAQVLVLGTEIASQLFPTQHNPVGEVVLVGGQQFTVIGVMQPKLQLWNYQRPDKYLVWMPANTYRGLANPAFINNIIVVPTNAGMTTVIQQHIRRLIAFNHGVDPNDTAIVSIQDSATTQQKTNQVFTGMEIFLGIIGGMTLLIAGIGVANVMLVSVKRATREIGIRMAIGARGYQVLLHYVVEGLLATAIGGAVGIGFAYSVTRLVTLIPIHGKIFQFLPKPQPVLSALVALIVILVLGLVGFFAGFFPARKAAAIDPAKALRYE